MMTDVRHSWSRLSNASWLPDIALVPHVSSLTLRHVKHLLNS